ncbi:hypothetical protein F0U60_16385 [Archangium minus]|uniref:SbsA Ig-like domain-containing protein n=1 Tax=Archangium minus TaxID=83450 RepID=A0ABY9WPC4_9BACT|nr:hypothetical protein F0U60_16385 [Archangium minus]
MRLTPVIALFAACALAPLACDNETPPSGTDAGTNPGTDAGTDGGTDAGEPRTSVSSSQPAEGASDLYPVEMYYDSAASRPGVYQRKVLSVTFSGPMDPSRSQVTLTHRSDSSIEPRTLSGQWSSDHRTLTVTLLAPEEGGPPLEEKSPYTLDLTQLRDEAGQPIDGAPVVGDGKLDFTTGARDGDLEHACSHTLVNTPVEHNAAPSKFASPPATDIGHARYRLTLPGTDGAYAGYSEFISTPDVDETISLYLDREVALSVRDETESVDAPVEVRAMPPACAGVTHRARFSAMAGDRLYSLHFGPASFTTFEFILERQDKK